MLPEFDLTLAESLPHALAVLAERAPAVKPIAGGTNLIVDMRARRACPLALVDISRLRELQGIRRNDGQVVVGATTTVAELLASELVEQFGLPLKQAAAVFASPLVRNRATVGGNLADASPAADTAPALLVLDAVVDLVSQAGTRCVPLEDLVLGPRKTSLEPHELLAAIRWPVPSPSCTSGFRKLGLRKADAIAVASAAVLLERDANGRCLEARIALGAVAPRPVRAYEAEAILRGQRVTVESIREAARLSAAVAVPISDLRGGADYRRRMVEVLVRRLLEEATNADQAD